MARFQYGGIIEQVASTATAAGTTTLVNTSKQIQIFTGSTTQTLVLPNATTFSTSGAHFEIYNSSTGIVTVKLNDTTTTLLTVSGGASALVKLSDNGTSNGSWVSFSSSSGGGSFSNILNSSPAGNVTTVTAGTVYLMDSSAARTIQLPTPSSGFIFFVADKIGTMNTFNTTLLRAGSEKIMGLASNFALEANWGEWMVYSDGTDWYLG